MAVEDLRNKLEQAAEKLVNLRIVTVLGDATVLLDDKQQLQLGGLTAASTFVTNINLLEGDIWTSSSASIAPEQLPEMRAYHDQMVIRAQDIVKRNLELMREVIDYFDDK